MSEPENLFDRVLSSKISIIHNLTHYLCTSLEATFFIPSLFDSEQMLPTSYAYGMSLIGLTICSRSNL